MTSPPDMTRGTLMRAAAGIAVVTAAARVAGLVRVFVLSRTVGGDPVLADTYQAANTVPNVLFELTAGGALAALVVPAVAGARDREAARRIAGALLTWAVLLLVPLALLGVALRGPVMDLLVGDVGDPARRAEQAAAGARMLVVLLPQVVLYGLGIVLTGVLQAHRRFLGPALAPLLSSAVVVGAYLLYASLRDPGISRAEERVLAVGTTLGVVALTLPLLVPAARLRLGIRPALRLPPDVGRQLRRLALWAAAGVAAQQLGGVLAYTVGQTVFLVPWAVLAVPVATSAYPDLARAAADGDDEAYDRVAAGALRAVVVATVLAAAAMAAAAGPGARLLLGVRAGGTDPDLLAAAVAAFAPGLVGYGLLALLTRARYARDDGRGPAAATVAGWAVAAVADLALVAALPDRHRVTALALGHTAGVTVGGLLLLRGLSARARAGAGRAAFVSVAGALVGGALGWAVARAVGDGAVARDLLACAAAGLVTAVAVAGALRVGAVRRA